MLKSNLRLTLLVVIMILLQLSISFEAFAADAKPGDIKGQTQNYNAGNAASAEVAVSPNSSEAVSSPYAGKYKGTFSGGTKGTITATADPNGGFIATLYYTKEKLSVDVTGKIDAKGNINCVMDSGEYKGRFNKKGRGSGSWKFGKMKGTWSAKRDK